MTTNYLRKQETQIIDFSNTDEPTEIKIFNDNKLSQKHETQKIDISNTDEPTATKMFNDHKLSQKTRNTGNR